MGEVGGDAEVLLDGVPLGDAGLVHRKHKKETLAPDQNVSIVYVLLRIETFTRCNDEWYRGVFEHTPFFVLHLQFTIAYIPFFLTPIKCPPHPPPSPTA